MKAKSTKKALNKDNKDKLPLPTSAHPVPHEFRFPLSFNGIVFGKISLSIDESEVEKHPESGFSVDEILPQVTRFIKFIQYQAGLYEKYRAKIAMSTVLFYSLYVSNPEKRDELSEGAVITQLGRYLYANNDAVFEVIEDEGPRILGSTDLQTRIDEWLRNPRVSSSRIEALKRALLSYAGTINKRSKDGRPEYELVNKLGDSGTLRTCFNTLTTALKIMKECSKAWTQNRAPRFSVNQPFEQLYSKMISPNANIKDWKTSAEYYALVENYFIQIQKAISCDKELLDQFLKLDWQPNELAFLMLKEALGVSVSKLKKTLYPKRKVASQDSMPS